MKDFKNSSLNPKLNIKPEYVNELFDYLKSITDLNPVIFEQLKEKLTGHFAVGYPIIHRQGHVSQKCWFVNSGMVIAYSYDHSRHIAAHTIFKAGEIALIPDSFMTNNPSKDNLIACPDTQLIEISREHVQQMHDHFPETERLAKLIIAHQTGKVRRRDALLRYKGKERIQQFFQLFPQVRHKEIKLMDRLSASYLMITEPSFSRLLKKIGKDLPEPDQ